MQSVESPLTSEQIVNLNEMDYAIKTFIRLTKLTTRSKVEEGYLQQANITAFECYWKVTRVSDGNNSFAIDHQAQSEANKVLIEKGFPQHVIHQTLIAIDEKYKLT